MFKCISQNVKEHTNQSSLNHVNLLSHKKSNVDWFWFLPAVKTLLFRTRGFSNLLCLDFSDFPLVFKHVFGATKCFQVIGSLLHTHRQKEVGFIFLGLKIFLPETQFAAIPIELAILDYTAMSRP